MFKLAYSDTLLLPGLLMAILFGMGGAFALRPKKNSARRTQRKRWEGFLILALLLLPACGGTSSSPPSTAVTKTVVVTITDQQITSSVTSFVVDVPYRFTVVNKTKEPSNLILLERPSSSAGSPSTGLLHLVPSTLLTPGATQHFTFAFPSTATTNLELATNLPGPSGIGKVLPIQTVR